MKRFCLPIVIAAWAFAQAPATAPAPEPGLYAIFTTSMGTITAQLFEKEAPITVRNFVGVARGTKAWKDPKTSAMVAKPLYDNITFHRVIPNFMIQTGDPTATGAHNCGFTPTLLLQQLQKAPFAEIVLRRRANHELAAVACKRAPAGEAEREALLAALEL